jgi:choline-sulfatase
MKEEMVLKKRNVLFIFTDQQRYDTIEAHGNPYIKTPVLNKLVEKGLSFTRAYSQCPVCVPARYGLLTGQAPHRTDCVDNQPTTPQTSLMEVLSSAGYQTHGVGKMHFTFKGEQNVNYMWGFDSRDTSEEGGGQDDFRNYLDANGYEHVFDPQGIRSEMYYIPQPSQLPERHHHSTWVVERSLDFLERRDTEKPFFLMTSFIKPHPPFETPTPWNKLYRGPDMPLPKIPDGYDKLITFWNRFQNRYKYRDQGYDRNLIRTMKAAYYSTISFIDYQVGRLMAYLETEGLMEDTLIIYSSDHGELLGDYHSYGKRSFLDSAARIPMLIQAPGIKGGQKIETPVTLLDIFPTILDYANISTELDLSGESMLKLAIGEVDRELVFGQFQKEENGMYMAVSDSFKYVYSAPDQREWLYDLKRDPDETRNVAENPLFLKKTVEFRSRLIGYFQEEGYLAPLDGHTWRQYPKKEMPEDPDAFLLMQDPPASIPDIEGYNTTSSLKTYYQGGWIR